MEMSSVKTNLTATVTVDTLSGPNGADALLHVEEVYRLEAGMKTSPNHKDYCLAQIMFITQYYKLTHT